MLSCGLYSVIDIPRELSEVHLPIFRGKPFNCNGILAVVWRVQDAEACNALFLTGIKAPAKQCPAPPVE